MVHSSTHLMLALLLGLLSANARADEDLAKELPRIPPKSPAEALKTFRIHPGFEIRAVAVEPLVRNPVSVCYDAEGRLYVVEMRGYPFPENVPSGGVARLEDTDGDGVFDKRSDFVTGLSWPTSVVPYDGGVFIAEAPDILYAKDTDGDGKADVKKVMFSGFGTQNVQALVNGLLWGPDGWIYGVGGGNGGEIRNLTKPDDKPVSIRGRDFRFKPDGSAFEAASGGGQFGHSFDDWGHRFTCNNSNHIRQIVLPADAVDRNRYYTPPAVLTDIAAEGPAATVFRISPPEPWRVVRTRQRVADPQMLARLPETERHAIGFFTSATGVTIYRGSAFPPEYRGNAFIGDVGGNLVHRKVLTRDGSIFKATRADEGVEFLASTDNWFRPVNFANTPDGTLLVLDMYRETIEHPASIPEPIKKHLDLTSGHDKGRIYEIRPSGFTKHRAANLSKATTSELVNMLGDADAWWRETAQRLLIERRDPKAPGELRRLARERATPRGWAHALWTLDAVGALGLEDLAGLAREDDPLVREQRARLLGRVSSKDVGPHLALADLSADPDAMVRLQVALSCGALEAPELNDAEHPVASLAGVAAVSPGNRWIRSAVLTSLRSRMAAIWLSAGLSRGAGGRIWVEDLSALIGSENNARDVAWFVGRFLPDVRDPALARAALLGLGRGLQRAGDSLRRVLDSRDADRIKPLFDEAARVALEDGESLARIESIRLLGLGPVDRATEALPALLDARQPTSIQLAALQALASVPDRRVGPAVVAHWKALGPALRREALEALLARADRISALLAAVEEKTIAPADLDTARRKQLLAHRDPEVRKRAAKLLVDGAKSDRGPVIAAYRKALDLMGDLDRGRAVFRKSCATCHKAEGFGTDVGPNLATVTNRTPEDLIVHILDPNREVPPAYLNYTVATTDGRVLTGLIAEESGNSVTLKRAEGATDVIPRGQIEQMASSGLSLMPEGVEKEVDAPAMADLVAYLRSIRGDAPSRPER